MDDENPFMRTFVPQLPSAIRSSTSQQRRFAHSSSQLASAHTKHARSNSPHGSSSSSRASSEEPLEDPLDWGGDVTEDRRSRDDPSSSSASLTALEESNIGMRMLLKLGWSQGQGLGKDGQGRLMPIDPNSSGSLLGIGKAALDTRMLDASTLSGRPRELESQRIAKETSDQRDARIAKAKFEEKVRNEVAETLKKFTCEICNKSYTTVGQYDEHTNSYDHHHRARAVATKQMERERAKANGEADKRREKERKREEKEMRKLMEKAGVKPPPIPTAGPAVQATDAKKDEEVKVGGDVKKGGWANFSGSGFAPIGGPRMTPSPSTSRSGFAPIESSKLEMPKSNGVGVWASISTPSAIPPEAMPPRPTPATSAYTKSARISAPPRFLPGGTINPSLDSSVRPPLPTTAAPPPPPPMPFDFPPSLPPPNNPPPPLPPSASRSRWNVMPPAPSLSTPLPPPPPPDHAPPPPPPGSNDWTASKSSAPTPGGFKPIGLTPSLTRGPGSGASGGAGFKMSFQSAQR